MPSSYLTTDDLSIYGLPSATTAEQIKEASTVIDSWLRRPEGLVWTAGSDGNPAYMAAAAPTISLSINASISPGASVQVAVSGPLMNVYIGGALVLDRATAGVTEVVRVTAKTGNTITLDAVTFDHAAGVKLEGGLAITERKYLPRNRPITRSSRHPLWRILAGRGRYAYPRRGDAHSGNTDDFNLLAVYNTFGGPPFWETINPAGCEFDAATGQIWIPAGIMLAYYTEVEITYLAGFSADTLPPPIKEACAKVVKALGNDMDLGAAKVLRAGDHSIERFSATIISDDIANLLQPYRVRNFG